MLINIKVNMIIQRLKPDIIAKIRSSSEITNMTQCVTELVLNSLDANSTAIAVRVNFATFRIQVVDNGEGITKENLEYIGVRYMTNKCNSLDQLEKHVKYYGFRGEALANIINISKTVQITCKYINSPGTYSKSFGKPLGNHVVSCGKNRPSQGTTITVEDFLYKWPVRRKRLVLELELENIKRSTENLILMHPNVSFSIRNDVTGNLILNSQRNDDIISSFKCLHPEINATYSLMKVTKDKMVIWALLFKELWQNNHLQYIYVNKRPVHCSIIQKYISSLFYKNERLDKLTMKDVNNKFPIYVMHIRCPHSCVDILSCPSKTKVEFKNWKTILRCVEKVVSAFFGNKCKISTNDKKTVMGEEFTREFKSDCGVSQIYGACKSYGYKRKYPEDDMGPHKLSIIDENCNTTVPRNNIKKSGIMRKSNELQLKKNSHNANSVQENIIEKDVSSNKSKKSYIAPLHPSTTRKKSKLRRIIKPLPVITKEMKNNNMMELDLSIKKCVNADQNINHNIPKQDLAIGIIPNIDTNIYNEGAKKCPSLAKCTPDENKGKSLIMDMFLKSTQVYQTSNDCESDIKTEKTVYEVTSNIFLEDNIQTHKNGFSKTISMSVNIRKKIKRKSRNHLGVKKISRYIQTATNNKMISKGIQTSLDQKIFKTRIHKLRRDYLNYKISDKLTENYTIVLSENCKSPYFKFIYNDPPHFNLKSTGKLGSSKYKFKCNSNSSKLFTFNIPKCRTYTKDISGVLTQKLNSPYYNNNYNLNEIYVSPLEYTEDKIIDKMQFAFQSPNKYCEKENAYTLYEQYVSNTSEYGIKTPVEYVKKCQNIKSNLFQTKHFKYTRSPYFLERHRDKCDSLNDIHRNGFKEKKNEKTNYAEKHFFTMAENDYSYALFHPVYYSTQSYDLKNETNNVLYLKKAIDKDKQMLPQNINISHAGVNTIDNFTMDRFENFRPVYRSTQLGFDNNSEHFTINTFQSGPDTDFTPLSENDSRPNTHISTPIKNNFNNTEGIFYEQNKTNENIYSEDIFYDKFATNNTDNIQASNVTAGIGVNGRSSNYQHVNKFQMIANTLDKKTTSYCSQSVPGINMSNDIFLGNKGILTLSPIPTNDFSLCKTNREERKRILNTDDYTELIISLNNHDKQEILENELNDEKKFNKRIFCEWDTQTAVASEKCEWQHNDSRGFGEEWIKKINNFGSNFYINTKSGFTTFFTPKQNNNNFKLDRRFTFMPKGLSPILTKVNDVDKVLSQNKKDKLQKYVLESHQNELLLVKWQNYMKGEDPKTFFEEVYKEKRKLFEDYIPSISTINCKKYLEENNKIHFNRTMFNNITVIGQVDRKFIAVLETNTNLLLLFDQHAVHERIRLEELIKAYANTKAAYYTRSTFFLTDNQLSLMKKYEEYLNYIGLSVEFFLNGIHVLEIPLCIFNKFKDDVNQTSLNKIIQLLINEIIELLQATRGACIRQLPNIIQSVIDLEACRGAIKFGDNLEIKDCIKLLEELANCNLPFQCAHGRPTLTPLLMLSSSVTNASEKIKYNNLFVI